MVMALDRRSRSEINAQWMNSVVELTNSIDTRVAITHRRSDAAAFGMCAGLAIPTVTHTKGGR
jgi:hypothetical protein